MTAPRPGIRLSLLMLAAIVAAYIVVGMQSIDKPGLYMDAVNPDYLVPRIVNPNTPTPYALLPGNLLFNRFPMLAGPYSGTYVAYLLVPFYLIFGGTLTAIRLAHFAFGLSIVLAVFLFLRESTRSLTIATTCAAVLAVDPAFTMIFRTQAYIVVFPVVITIAGLYVLMRYRSLRATFVGGVLLGLAVFGYFVFAFVLPGVVAFVLTDGAAAQRGKQLAALCAGIAVGCIGFVLGYGLVIQAMGLEAGVGWIFALVPALLHVNDRPSFADNFLWVTAWIWRVATTDWDVMTFWQTEADNVGQTVKAALLVLLSFAGLPFALSGFGPARAFRLTVLATASFTLVATLFGKRLGGHDVTPMLPLLYLCAGLALALIASQPQARRISGGLAAATVAGGIVLCGVNVSMAAAMTAQLAQHSANGLFSSIFSDYPAQALAANDTTPHVFWKWGSQFQFIFLTEGKIPATSSGGLMNAVCTYGRAKIVLTGDETAHHPDLDFVAEHVTVVKDRLLHDTYSGYPYEVITVRPIAYACEPPPPAATSVPPGLDLPDGVFADASMPFEGVYPSAPPECCLLGRQATFGVRVPPGERTLRFTVYALNYPQIAPQRLTIAIDGKTVLRSGVLPKGMTSTLEVPLPPHSFGKRAVRVTIVPATSFVPKDLGIDGDTRRLSAALSGVEGAASAHATAVGAAPAKPSPQQLPTQYDYTTPARPPIAPDGLYLDDSAGCCFAGKSVTFRLSAPPGSTRLNVTLYPPVLPAHPGRPVTMIATFDGAHPVTVAGLTPGIIKTYPVELPAVARHEARLSVTLTFPQPFTPKDEGINDDRRTLSVVIRRVAFAR